MPTCPPGFSLYTYPQSGYRVGQNIFDNTSSYTISPSPGDAHVTFEDGKPFKTPIVCRTHIWALDGSRVKIFDEVFTTTSFSSISTSISGSSYNWTYTIVNNQTGDEIIRISRAQLRPVLMFFRSVKAANSTFFVPIWHPFPTSLMATAFKVFHDGSTLLGTVYPRIVYRHITLIRRISDNQEMARFNIETPFYTLDPVIIGKSNYSSAIVYSSQGVRLRSFSESPNDLRFENYYQGITISTNIPSTLNLWWPNISLQYLVLDQVNFNDGRSFILSGYTPNDVLPYNATSCFRCEPPDRGNDHCYTCPPRSDPTGGADPDNCVNVQSSVSQYYWFFSILFQHRSTEVTNGQTTIPDDTESVHGTFWYNNNTLNESSPGYLQQYSSIGRGKFSWSSIVDVGGEIPQGQYTNEQSNKPGWRNQGAESFPADPAIAVRPTLIGTYTQYLHGYYIYFGATNSCPGYPLPTPVGNPPDWYGVPPVVDSPNPPPNNPPNPPPPCRNVVWIATLIRFNIEAAFEAVLDFIPIPGIRVPSILIPPDSPYAPLFDVLTSLFSGSPITADQVRNLYDLLLSTLTLVLPPNIRDAVQLLLTLCTPEPLHNISGTACGDVTVKKVAHQTFLMSDTASKLISDDPRLIFVVLNSGYV